MKRNEPVHWVTQLSTIITDISENHSTPTKVTTRYTDIAFTVLEPVEEVPSITPGAEAGGEFAMFPRERTGTRLMTSFC